MSRTIVLAGLLIAALTVAVACSEDPTPTPTPMPTPTPTATPTPPPTPTPTPEPERTFVLPPGVGAAGMITQLTDEERDCLTAAMAASDANDEDPFGAVIECMPSQILDAVFVRNQYEAEIVSGLTVADTLDILPGNDAACLSAALEAYPPQSMQANIITVLRASVGTLEPCFSDQGATEIYLAVSEGILGHPIEGEARECLTTLLEEHNHFARATVGLAQPGVDVDSQELVNDYFLSQRLCLEHDDSPRRGRFLDLLRPHVAHEE